MKKIITSLSDPQDHAQALHPDSALGKVTLAKRAGNGKWHEWRVSIPDIPNFAQQFSGKTDVYLTQNRFWNRRIISQTAQLDALFADLDYYNIPEFAGKHPWFILELALDLLLAERIPQPSFAVSTGRGIALVWLHDAVPRQALPRWNACQQHIWSALKTLGADPKARDAARVLRLVGTENSKNNVMVEALTNVGDRWDFNSLADEVLPNPRAEIHDLRVQRALKGKQKKYVIAPAGFNVATLWEGRLTEMQILRNHRWWGGLPPGQRDAWLFIACNAMAHLTTPLFLRREFYGLAHEVSGWDERESSQRMGSVFARAHRAARGETVEYRGQQHTPLYRFMDKTIIEWLAITEAEMRECGFRHLCTPEMKREHHAELERARKHKTGENKQTRAEYESQAKQNRRKAIELKNQGMSIRKIADSLAVSRGSVEHYLR